MTADSAAKPVIGLCAPAAPAADGVRGVGAAAAAGIQQALASGQGDQLDLLPPDRLAPRSLTVDEAEAERIGAERRAAGRPPGARNLRTRELTAYLGAVGAHPAFQMVEWLRMSPEAFAVRFSCSRAEAFDRQQRMREALLPYVLPRLAPVDEQGKSVPFMVFNMGAGAGQDGAQLPPWLDALQRDGLTIDSEQNQALSTGLAGDPNGGDPNRGGKP
jgi:hypothetical protein